MRHAVVFVGALTLFSGCRGDTAPVTGLRIVTSWPADVQIDQLEFSVSDSAGNKFLLVPQNRPRVASGPLASGSDVYVYFRDDVATDKGLPIRADVRGFVVGVATGAGQGIGMLMPQTVTDVKVRLETSIAGGTLRSNGAACKVAAECQSRSCADGICCDTACNAVCTACNVPGSQGTCSPVPDGVNHKGCADQGAAACGFDGACDGRGACRKYPAGAPCAAGTCSGSSVAAASACDGAGKCVPGIVRTCAPFTCNTAAAMPSCFARCTSNAECVMGRECQNGSCGKKQDGAVCVDGAECTSGFCVDGTCCDSKCDGPCVSCVQVGAVGDCKQTSAGVKDPRGVCKDDGPSSCGTTGACDGKGACARYSAGTVCVAAVCSTPTLLQSAGRCDGLGKCQAGGQLACAPYVCRNAGCVGSCQKNDDCAVGQVCDVAASSCGKKGLGQACTVATECNSTFCVDGVCCNETCVGACRTCSGGRTPGSCTPVAAGGADVRMICRDQGQGSCGTDGLCDGAGGCHRYAPGTVCGTGSCNAMTNMRTMPAACDAMGRCAPGTIVGCGGYKCNGAACFSACATDLNCVAPNVCIGGACTQKGSGDPCTRPSECAAPFTCIGSVCQLKPLSYACAAGRECASGFCTEGVCCEAADCGKCKSCRVASFVGYCHALAAGTVEPRMMCAVELATSCGTDGTCDGAGGCRLHPAGTTCAPANCSGRIRNNPRTCDGLGVCQARGAVDCYPYTCNANAAACYRSCNDSSDCCCGRCRNDSCG